MEYIICGILGLISGLVFYYLAIHHVKVRSEYDNGQKLDMLKNKKFIPIWMLMSVILFLIVACVNFGKGQIIDTIGYWHIVRILAFAMLALNVAAVDILLRRIPNAILLGMILLQIANIAMEVVMGANPMDTIISSFVGMFLAYIVFMLPAMLKLSVGMGDVKYSAVIGFTMGFNNYVEAMAIMAMAILIFYLYLKLTKKGNIKTAAPMAPFLSIGAFVALLFPMF